MLKLCSLSAVCCYLCVTQPKTFRWLDHQVCWKPFRLRQEKWVVSGQSERSNPRHRQRPCTIKANLFHLPECVSAVVVYARRGRLSSFCNQRPEPWNFDFVSGPHDNRSPSDRRYSTVWDFAFQFFFKIYFRLAWKWKWQEMQERKKERDEPQTSNWLSKNKRSGYKHSSSDATFR